MNILVAGGAGYIGSHTCVELLNNNHNIIIIDNLSNSNPEVLNRIKKITGKTFEFYCDDILNKSALDKIFQNHQIDVVINFAGLKAVGESVEEPLKYYYTNVTGMITLCNVMKEYNVKNIIFSSTATVYGNPNVVPITEDSPIQKIHHPYGQTKAMIEQILQDIYISDQEWNIVILRYFNPIGAHESGLIGEDPKGIPNNLLPYIAQVAVGKRPYLKIFGNDYDTYDGTGVRDYIHITDLAKGHVASLKKLYPNSGVNVYNLGTGKGYSVMDVLHTYETVCGKNIPYKIESRRLGDIDMYYCSADKAREELEWTANKTLYDMCSDSWRWQSMNPDGYLSELYEYF